MENSFLIFRFKISWVFYLIIKLFEFYIDFLSLFRKMH